MADFNQPALTSLYTDMVDTLKARDVDGLKWLDGTTSTNVPSGAKRWNSTNNYFEKYNGTAWVPLTSKYIIDVDKVDGCTVNDLGVSATDLWSASKTTNELNAKLNASSYTAADVLTKIKTVDGAASGLDADLLDGMHAGSTNTASTIVSRDASGNFSAGTITATLNGNAASATTAGTCTGNAATATTATNATTAYGLQAHAARNNEANKVVRTDGSGYIQAGYINSSNGNEKNNIAAPYVWGTNGSDDYLRTYATSALNVGGAAKASTIAQGGGAGPAMTFNWSGQSGQPPWLWGGTDGANMYVYNPSSFVVAKANSVTRTLVASGNFNPSNISGEGWLYIPTNYSTSSPYLTTSPLGQFVVDIGIGGGGVYSYQYRVGLFPSLGLVAGYTSGGAADGGYTEGELIIMCYFHSLYGSGYVSGGLNWKIYRIDN